MGSEEKKHFPELEKEKQREKMNGKNDAAAVSVFPPFALA